MSVAYAIVAMGAVLLVCAGVSKVIWPDSARMAMRAVGLPSSNLAVRTGSIVECVIGIAALIAATWWSCALVAASFASFAVFLSFAIRSQTVSDCGCFGARGRPPRRRQIFLDAAIALAGAIAFATAHRSALFLLVNAPVEGACFMACTLVSAILAYRVHESTVPTGGV
jgi:hypothetical protein